MFRKYYKEANSDIKIDGELVDRVIASARGRVPSPKKKYYKYVPLAAAAVLIVSAAVISMPVRQKTIDNNGVIIEEAAVSTASPRAGENTPVPKEFSQPQTDAAAYPPEDNSRGASSGAARKDTSEHSYKSGGEGEFNETPPISSVTDAPSAEAGESAGREADNHKTENKMFDEGNHTADSGEGDYTADTYCSDARGSSDETEFEYLPKAAALTEDDAAQSESESAVYGDTSTSGAGGASGDTYVYGRSLPEINQTLPNINLQAPTGFYVESSSGGTQVFSDGNGAEIYISAICTDAPDSAPVYSRNGNNISAELTANGIHYIISSFGASAETVEELANSI